MPLDNLRKIHLYLSVILCITACSGKSKKDLLIEELAADLQQSNASINAQSSHTFHQLNNKKTEPATVERAGVWLPKAEKVLLLTNEFIKYLNVVKDNEANEADSIKVKTEAYAKEFMKVDERVMAEFSKNVTELRDFADKKHILKKANENAFLETLISKARRLELKTITFCNEQVGSLDGHGFFDYYSSIVGQSSTILKPGEILEITAGIGAFSKIAQPKIVIEGKTILLNEYGLSKYRTKVPLKPGNYSLPVKISYFDQVMGLEMIRKINIEYTVTAPCN
jgi:hypothetical protein